MNEATVVRGPSCQRWMALILTFILLGVAPERARAADFDGDADLDIDDIDALVTEIVAGTNDPRFDLTGDGLVDIDDLDTWRLAGAIVNGFADAYLVGDADLNGSVESSDVAVVLANQVSLPAIWSRGDFNADGVIFANDHGMAILNLGQSIPLAEPGEIGSEPVNMDFGSSPLGNNETRVLNLTNTASEGVLGIGSVQFTYNQQDVFGLNTTVPATLMPGDSLEVDLDFSPVEPTFFMGSIQILSNATNAPVLNYDVLGQGEFTPSCMPPLVSCGGSCIDLTDDLFNCGSCNNVCASPFNGAAICEAASCGFVCDAGYEPFDNNCQAIVPETPLELFASLNSFVDDAVASGALIGYGPNVQSAENRLSVFIQQLEYGYTALMSGQDNRACGSLNFLKVRSSGVPVPSDFVTADPDTLAGLHAQIEEIANAMPRCPLR